MGNVGSTSSSRRRQQNHPIPAPAPAPQQREVTANRYVFAAATPYPSQYSNPNPMPYNQYPGYCPPLPVQTPYGHHYRGGPGGGVYPGPAHPNWVSPHYPRPAIPAPFVEHQKAVTVRNDVNVKKETLRVEPDEENPGKFLVAFTFDATAPGSITVMFFAKENIDCNLIVTKESLLKPVTVTFEQGLGQKFRQPSGTGIDFSVFEEAELIKSGDIEVYPLVVKAEACPVNNGENESNGSSAGNSQITQAVFKNKGEYQVRVVKQILWVNQMRYELQEIYGIGNTVEGDFDGNDSGKECVICLSEPRDTTVLPCRHMCMCSSCAKILKCYTDQCPICRQPVERLLEIKVSNGPEG